MEAQLSTELLKEHLKRKLCDQILPTFWSHFDPENSPEDNLKNILAAINALNDSIDFSAVASEMKQLYPDRFISGLRNDREMVFRVLRLSVSVTLPPGKAFLVMEAIVARSLSAHAIVSGEEGGDDEEMETETCSDSVQFWNEFLSLTSRLDSLGLRDCFLVHPAAAVIERKVKEYVTNQCTGVYDTGLLDDTVAELKKLLHNWLTSVFGVVTSDWSLRILHYIYSCYGQLRIQELFDIIVDYPDSEPTLIDLQTCLSHIDLRAKLMETLKEIFKQRLLHHGANTADIITQYISSIRSLRILDPSGVVLERVCEPVRTYLRSRVDTVSCIMTTLIDDSNNELYDELAKGEAMLLDLSDDCEDPDQDFDKWEPDPIDSDPTKSSKSRKTSDIISLLVHIYGSQELFVTEYRSLLADRLLLSLDYDTTKELRNLELLKLRFGESNLHFCEVMVKDVSDSRRVNLLINSKLQAQRQLPSNRGAAEDDVKVNSFILSHVFWPSFKSDSIKLPPFIQKKLDRYNACFQEIKGMRKLEWCVNLGLVQLELEVKGQTISLQVSPPRASIIWQYQSKNCWSVEELSRELDAQPSMIRRHLLYWVSQGILYEEQLDIYRLVEKDNEREHEGGAVDDDRSLLEDQKENDLQMVWSYINAMLTNLGPLSLDKIQTMLNMFMTQGPHKTNVTTNELKTYLDKKVKSQELVCTGGIYQLNKSI